MISLQQIINSSLSLRLVSILAQRLSPRLGYPFAHFVAEQIARQRNSKLVRAVRANQWVIRGERLDAESLDRVVHETFHAWARSLFDLYHYIDDMDVTSQLIVVEPSFQKFVQRPEFDEHGLVLIGLHLSNFDLILQWLSKGGLKPLVLTIPDPQGGRRVEYEMRKRTGLNLVPGSVSALRQAIKYLQRGGTVVTGIDRPIPDPNPFPRFFGRPAALPVHHIFLATKAHVPIVVGVVILQSDGKYHVSASDPIEMDHHPDVDAGILHNAEKVLAVAEEFIRQAPQQWSVPLPVWPQVMDLVPK
ncbi:MAG TPA: lysophospholipid acyltransferase family protein [Anaerolineales bacterium]|nr:lysophospholipid acyltransferase family protein [Anaerolineales bacterium]